MSNLPLIILESSIFQEMNFYDQHFWSLLIRFSFNFLIILLIVGLIYYPSAKNRDYAFTFFLFNPLIFFVCYLLSNEGLSIGFAFGLFAVFSILRYRTTTIPIREMTYLFIVITLAVINALSAGKVSYSELIFTNFFIVLLIYLLETLWYRKALSTKTIRYEKIEWIKPEHHDKLMMDLRERTGLDIKKFDILRLDYLRDTVRIRLYYREPFK